MNNRVRDFAKCAIVNKASLAGYAGIGVGALMSCAFPDLDPDSLMIDKDLLFTKYCSYFIGSWLCLLTLGGYDTYSTYRKTKNLLNTCNRVESRVKLLIDSSEYCISKGRGLALEEHVAERVKN